MYSGGGESRAVTNSVWMRSLKSVKDTLFKKNVNTGSSVTKNLLSSRRSVKAIPSLGFGSSPSFVMLILSVPV